MSNLNVKLLKNVESKTKIYLAIIAIILIALCINNIAYIIPSIIGYALIIVYTIWVYKRRKSEISNYITDLTINVDSAAKNTLINSPFPIIILETDGNVIWRSSKFNKEFANVGINSYIDDIAKEIKMDIENQDTTQIDKQISIEDKIYHVIGNFVKIKQKAVRLLGRNAPYHFSCSVCGKEAAYLCCECQWTQDNPFLCEDCAREHEHGSMLPVVNSPRMGVCAYCGEMDIYEFEPDKTDWASR